MHDQEEGKKLIDQSKESKLVPNSRQMPTVLCSSADPFTAVCAAGAAHVATGDVRGRVCLWAIAQAVGVDDSPPHEPLLLLHEGEEVGGLAVTGMDYHPPSDTLVCVFGSSCSRAWPLSALLEHGPARCRAQSSREQAQLNAKVEQLVRALGLEAAGGGV